MLLVTVIILVLHGADGGEVRIAPGQVTVLRSPMHPRAEHFPANAHCMIGLTDGKFVAVTETCSTVQKLVEESK
jgi:hypothetical protein